MLEAVMPWNALWYDKEEMIIMYEPVEPWTWEEFVDAIRRGQDMMREKPHFVDTIYNLHPPITMPSSSALGYFREVYATDPENSGINAVIGATSFVESLVSVITSVMGGKSRFKFVSGMEEALAVIEKARAERAGKSSE
jgi:hypothetical protein